MLLKRITEAIGVSGCEDEIRSLISAEIKGFVDELHTDNMGNLIALKKAKKGIRNPKKLMLSAHMDEVGFMIMGADSNGLLKFAPIGGIDPRILPTKRVCVGKDKVMGVIGSKPIHLQEAEERKKPYSLNSMYIDVGASKKDEVLKKIKIGDYVGFAASYEEMGNSYAKGKAFDDRVGCAVLIEILKLKKEYDFDLYCAFSTQEELGLRGSGVAAFSIKPDVALVVECTTSHDLPKVEPHLSSTYLGSGPVIVQMDKSLIVDKNVVDRLVNVATNSGIPFQSKQVISGGTDAGRIRLTSGGIPCGLVALPCRYLHSPACVINLDDYRNLISLVREYVDSFNAGGFDK